MSFFSRLVSSFSKQASKPDLALQVEALEPRMMLSTVSVIAAGTTGVEQIELRIDGAVAKTWNDLGSGAYSGQYVTRSHTTTANINPGQVRINFTNDLYTPGVVDRNVRIDAILIDGVRYEAEHPSVYSTGTWLPADGVVPGHRTSEYLHANGYLQFAPVSTGGSLVEIRAAGNEGGEQFNLRINGLIKGTYTATKAFQTFSYSSNALVTADQVRIEFTNDSWLPPSYDRNLIVDYIQVNGTRFQTEAPAVYSTGTWLPADGIVPGFRKSETLHTNGYFQYASTNTNSVTFAAFGDYGTTGGGAASVGALVNQKAPDFIVTTGDSRYGNKTYSQIHNQYYSSYIDDAQPGGVNRFFPAVGNHDYEDGGGISEYLNYFNLPGDGVVSVSNTGSELYYDFVQGPVHFFVVDSQAFLYNATSRATQTAWLQAQVQASTSPWQVVVMHHSPYSSGSVGPAPVMRLPYASWGVDLVLSGHDHDYERLNLNGLTYVVTGLGGDSIFGFGTPVAGSVVRYAGNYGINMFTATPTQLTGTFVSVDGVTRDSFSVTAN